MSIMERVEALLDTTPGTVIAVIGALCFGAMGIWMFVVFNDREY